MAPAIIINFRSVRAGGNAAFSRACIIDCRVEGGFAGRRCAGSGLFRRAKYAGRAFKRGFRAVRLRLRRGGIVVYRLRRADSGGKGALLRCRYPVPARRYISAQFSLIIVLFFTVFAPAIAA
jgi:hypothetical protein